MFCANCNSPWVAGAPACQKCGAPGATYAVPNQNTPLGCPRCRTLVTAQAQQCHGCGLSLSAYRPVPVQVPPQQPPQQPQQPPQQAQPQMQRPCQRCGTAIPSNFQYCQPCAQALAAGGFRQQTVPCPRCNAQVVVGSRACQSCGFMPSPVMMPPPGAMGAKPESLISNFWSQLDSYASLDKLEGFSLSEMFSEVFRNRSQDEVDDYFQVGSRHTTPDIREVPTAWPKPWFFGRVLVFIAFLYFVQFIAFQHFQNPLMLPGMMMTGALAMPFATAILFFELNAPRNVSFHRVLMLVCGGGVLSIFVSLIGFDLSHLHQFLGAPAAGVVEEIGKLLAVIIMARKVDKLYILNGCLFGAAVGAGFAAFESAGYAFNAFLSHLPDKSQAGILFAAGGMAKSIWLRGILAPFGHVAWTGITAGVLWRSRSHTASLGAALGDGKFVRAFCLVMGLHALWNFSAGFPSIIGMPVMALVGIVSWYLVFGIVQQGLRQVKAAQKLTKTAQIQAFDPATMAAVR